MSRLLQFVFVLLALLVFAKAQLPKKIPTEIEGRTHASKLKDGLLASSRLFEDDGTASRLFKSGLRQIYPFLFTPQFSQQFMSHLESEISEFIMSSSDNSSACAHDILQFVTDVYAEEAYIFKVLDAFGKIPSGVTKGNVAWLGSYDLCRSIIEYRNNSDEIKFEGKYCLASVKGPFLPKQLQFLSLSLGTCVPKTCNEEDLVPFLHMGLDYILKALKVDDKTINGTLAQSVMSCARPAEWTAGDITAIFFTSLLVFLALVGTFYDIFQRIMKTHAKSLPKVYIPDSGINGQTEDANADLVANAVPPHGAVQTHMEDTSTPKIMAPTEGNFHKFLMGFSFITNGEKLLSGSIREGTLGAVNGIRVLSMWWVILGHTHLFTAMGASNILDMLDVLKRFSFQAVSNATYSVDSFFFLSGLLVTYLLLRELKRNSGKTNWILLYVHRYWRLTPTLMFVIMIYSTLYLHLPEGPIMRAVDAGAEPCRKYWWTNLLYINNFHPSSLGEECMGWSWYLANDMQFFILSPFIIYLLYRFRYAGYAVIAVLILTCFISTGVVARIDHASAYILAGNNGEGFNTIYVRPWYRISPYLVGIISGYCIHIWNENGRPRLHKAGVIAGWCMAIAINMSVLYGLYGQMQSGIPWNDDVSALYIATSRFAWSLGLGWLTFACITGYGGPINTFLSWGVWAPLGRLTYCAYLVHPIIIFNYIWSRRHPIYYSDYNMVYFYIGHIVISYLAAFVVSLLVEAPTMALEKLIFKRKQS